MSKRDFYNFILEIKFFYIYFVGILFSYRPEKSSDRKPFKTPYGNSKRFHGEKRISYGRQKGPFTYFLKTVKATSWTSHTVPEWTYYQKVKSTPERPEITSYNRPQGEGKKKHF